MATFNIQLPNVRQLDWNDKRTQNMLLDFFNELTEKLNYTLNNMDLTNFDRQTYVNLAKYTEQTGNIDEIIEKLNEDEQDTQALFNELRDMIINTADSITQAYTKLFYSDDEKWQSVYSLVTEATGEYGSLTDAWQSSITQEANKIKAEVSSTSNILTKNLQEFQNTVTSYFQFDTSGLTIGKADSEFKTFIDNRKLSFMQGSVEVAYISDEKLNITEAEIDKLNATNVNITGTLTQGPFEWVINANGSYGLRKKA